MSNNDFDNWFLLMMFMSAMGILFGGGSMLAEWWINRRENRSRQNVARATRHDIFKN